MNEIIKNIRKRAIILGYPVDLTDMENALEIAENYINAKTCGQIVTLNPEMIMQGKKNPELSNALLDAELVLPDGIGVVIALKKIGIHIKRLPGIEFSEALIKKCAEKGYNIGFLGASKDVLEATVNIFQAKYPLIKIVYTHDGYFNGDEEIKIANELKNSHVQVLFVALGVPKQEVWSANYKNILNSVIMVGVGGSFDVWSKKVKRAPVIFRKFGLEWFFRLISQPSRFKRMFPTLPLFYIKVLLDRRTTRKENYNE